VSDVEGGRYQVAADSDMFGLDNGLKSGTFPKKSEKAGQTVKRGISRSKVVLLTAMIFLNN